MAFLNDEPRLSRTSDVDVAHVAESKRGGQWYAIGMSGIAYLSANGHAGDAYC